MNTATAKKPLRVLLDTNILVSAIVFGGKPGKILSLALEQKFQVIISPVLLAELFDVVNKKFPLSLNDFKLLGKQINKTFDLVNPHTHLSIVKDEKDNRVLEAAVEGRCDLIVTGDKELLDLGEFEKIKIVSAAEFMKLLE